VIVFWLILVAAFVGLARWRAERPLPPPPLPPLSGAPGAVAPALALPGLDGQSASLAELRGQVVLLNFWATWCEPCRDELPALEALHRDLGGAGLRVVGVALDTASTGAIARYVRGAGISFPIWTSPPDALDRHWNVRAYPSTWILDREGHVRAALAGAYRWDAPSSRGWLRELLAQ